MNRDIRAHSIRVISETGEQLGIMAPGDALRIAQERGLDLVEVASDARPPVCKIMDYGKLRYDQSRRKVPKPKYEIKTITLRPKTGEHDLETKLRQARKFLERGDKVRFQVRMRGRERARPGMWADQLMAVMARLSDIAVVVQRPAQEGRGIFAMVEPTKSRERPPPKSPPSGDSRGRDKEASGGGDAPPPESEPAA